MYSLPWIATLALSWVEERSFHEADLSTSVQYCSPAANPLDIAKDSEHRTSERKRKRCLGADTGTSQVPVQHTIYTTKSASHARVYWTCGVPRSAQPEILVQPSFLSAFRKHWVRARRPHVRPGPHPGSAPRPQLQPTPTYRSSPSTCVSPTTCPRCLRADQRSGRWL